MLFFKDMILDQEYHFSTTLIFLLFQNFISIYHFSNNYAHMFLVLDFQNNFNFLNLFLKNIFHFLLTITYYNINRFYMHQDQDFVLIYYFIILIFYLLMKYSYLLILYLLFLNIYFILFNIIQVQVNHYCILILFLTQNYISNFLVI